MKKFAQTGMELLLIGLSILLASQIYLKFNLIPGFIFSYQHGYYSDNEIVTISLIFVIVGFVILFPSKFKDFGAIFQDQKYFAREIFIILMASSLSSLVLFIFTKIFFDPNFIAWEFVIVFVLYISLFAIEKILRDIKAAPRTLFQALGRLIPEIGKYAFSWAGVSIILISLLPLITAVQFKRDEDFAHEINKIRNISTGLGLEWRLVPDYVDVSLTQPIFLQYHPNDTNKLFLLERAGKLFALDRSNTGSKELILDFSGRVGEVQVENGALGFALHPRFGSAASPNNGFVYIYYTDVHKKTQRNRLSRFDLVKKTLEDRLASETVLIEQERNSSGFHNGGSVEFGTDGFLYIGIGEANDHKNLQTISNSLYSGIFRIDVDMKADSISHPIPRQPRAGQTGNYMIPNDNPFVGIPQALEEFWALGLRNPFRFSIDRMTGHVWVGDVGSSQVEEIDFVEGGGNYQYPYFEGSLRATANIPDDLIGQDSPPFFTYLHNAYERAIIGGIIYRGEKHKELYGKYVFADNGSGHLYVIDPKDVGEKDKVPLAKTSHFGYLGIAGIVESPNGEILVIALGSKKKPSGKILRLEKDSDAPLLPFLTVFQSSSPDQSNNQPPTTTYTIEEIQDLFTDNCSRCHGLDGKGTPELSPQLAAKIPNFSDPPWQETKSDEHLIKVISKGGAALGLDPAMPPWEAALDEKQIDGLVKHIRTLGGKTSQLTN